ncbi:MAG: response regulator [Acidobacteria bacterium]|nr:response regulator [Acidobacteriota bacterium]
MSRTILVVDNNAFYRQVLGDFFRSEGFDVAVAGDGVEALERVALGGVDFILLDLIMPRVDGARLCRYLKAHPDYSAIPVVILSGILADEIEDIDTINADAYVAKMPMEQLEVTLRSVFAKLDGRPAAPVLEGFDKMFRREVVLELLEDRRVRDLILDSIAEGIVELTPDRKILRTNMIFDRMVGRPGSALLSLPIADSFPGSKGVVEGLFADAAERRGRPASAIVEVDGRSLRVRLHTLETGDCCESNLNPTIRRVSLENPKVRLIEPGTLPGYVVLVEDVTSHLEAQEERERYREKLQRSERMSALGMFASGAAHELNNPLTAVLGYAQLLGAKPLPADVKSSLRKIEEGAARCRSIVENLLTFSRIEIPERAPEPINDLVREAVQECLPRAEAAQVAIRTRLADGLLPAEVKRGDMLQALLALLDNAVRAAAGAERNRLVEVTTAFDDGSIVVEISDNGPGIPARILGRIFDPFFGTREVGDGKGLGLSIAYGILRAHGGSLSARNREVDGACLTMRVPCEAGRADVAVPADSGSTKEVRRKSGRRLLIVDDEQVVLELLIDLLGTQHHIDTAGNGRDGLALAVSGKHDLILLDIKMPDMTGRQMFESLVAKRPEMASRVIFTTGDSMEPQTKKFLESTGTPVITKPFSLDTVTDLVDRLLAASRKA